MSVPRVSVVMSVYNGSTFLRRSMDSILGQSWSDFELIIIDDGSVDDSPLILAEYQSRDLRVQVLTQSNTGLTRSLIRGCETARGEFIARHDADDWSAPERLARQVTLLDSNPAIGFVTCTSQYVGPRDELLESVSRTGEPAEVTRKLMEERQGPPAHGSVMFRRSVYEAVGGYRAEFYFGQDADLWMRMAERSLMGSVPVCLYHVRRHPDSVSGAMGELQSEFGKLGQQCRAARLGGQGEEVFLAQARQLSERIPKRANGTNAGRSAMAYLIGATLRQNNDARARDYFWQAIVSNPWNWRAWCRWLVN
ncbi:MAG TPA: glycosyltransferase family 2 protein [Planctomycetaceae bacterium]|jgi:glycosyltransferase involved in cell wall biosynthesis|nr:glycosyltransferase family 2 protein [Planctomycetaceae bacterium]